LLLLLLLLSSSIEKQSRHTRTDRVKLNDGINL
jgi:hypothetical protein